MRNALLASWSLCGKLQLREKFSLRGRSSGVVMLATSPCSDGFIELPCLHLTVWECYTTDTEQEFNHSSYRINLVHNGGLLRRPRNSPSLQYQKITVMLKGVGRWTLLSHLNPFYTLTPQLTKTHLNIILRSTTSFRKRSLPLIFSTSLSTYF
jgi:hypothetical protein